MQVRHILVRRVGRHHLLSLNLIRFSRLNSDLTELTNNVIGTSTTLSSAVFTCPSDGYVYAVANGMTGARIMLQIRDANGATIGHFGTAYANGGNGTNMLFVRKGMKVLIASSEGGSAWYIPLEG